MNDEIIFGFTVICAVLILMAMCFEKRFSEINKAIKMLNEDDECTIRKLKWLFNQLDQLKQDIEVQADIRKINNDLLWESMSEIEDEIKKLKEVQINDTNALIRRMGEVERQNISIKSNFLILREAIMIVHEEVKKLKRKELLKTKTKFKRRKR